MTNEEYSLLFHRAQVNLVAFKRVNDCDSELRGMVEMAVAAEREECAKLCDRVSVDYFTKLGKDHAPWMKAAAEDCATDIRARGNRT